MSPNDRYQICSNISGLICTASTRTEAFRIGAKHARTFAADGWDIGAHDYPIEVFDCFAHVGKPELWRYDDDSKVWSTVALRARG